MGRNNQAKRKAKKKTKAKTSPKRLPQISVRPCNGCTACCAVFGVETIEKQPWERCEHQVPRGCSIYTERPKMCQTFYCLWQSGLGEEDERPDNFGLILAPTKGKTEFTGEQEIQAYEMWENAANQSKPSNMLQRLARKGALVILHTYGGKTYKLMGPEQKVAQASAFFRRSQSQA